MSKWYATHGRVVDWLWLLAWGIASSAWCLGAARQVGATFDEPFNMARGMEFWRTGSHADILNRGTMPLPMDLATLPAYLWERGKGYHWNLTTDWEIFIVGARATNLLFWWLLLIYGGLIGRSLGGPWGGRLAVALLAAEPILIAHACLATADIAISACLLALVYHFRTGREPGSGWVRRIGLPGLWFGIAYLCKSTGPVFGPLCMVTVEVEHLARSGFLRLPAPPEGITRTWLKSGWAWVRQAWGELRPFRRDFLQIAALGAGVSLVYCGCDWRPHPEFVAWAHHLPDGLAGRSMIWLADHLCIFSNAAEGLLNQISHNNRGHGVFVLGITNPRAVWYYFPVALAIKLSLPLLTLPLLLALVRPRTLANWACLAAVALLAFSFLYRVQIGIRLIFPIVVLAVTGLAAAAANAYRQSPGRWRRGLLAGGLGCGIAWAASSTVLTWPDGLCYNNELWGSKENGYLLLSDSNYDWGQGLKELVRWQRRQGIASLDVWYFGADPVLQSLPLRPLQLEDRYQKEPEAIVNHLQSHLLAAGTSSVYGETDILPATRLAAFLKTCQPVARTKTFLIYDFSNWTTKKKPSNSP